MQNHQGEKEEAQEKMKHADTWIFLSLFLAFNGFLFFQVSGMMAKAWLLLWIIGILSAGAYYAKQEAKPQ
jgi:hypothetical protein